MDPDADPGLETPTRPDFETPVSTPGSRSWKDKPENVKKDTAQRPEIRGVGGNGSGGESHPHATEIEQEVYSQEPPRHRLEIGSGGLPVLL